jgi:hypothetical protein
MAKGRRFTSSPFVNLSDPDKNKGTGFQIRDYLARVGSDYQMNIWRAIVIESETNGCNGPTWASFRNFFSLLKRAELIVEDTAEGDNSIATDTSRAVIPTAWAKKYYKLNRAKVNSPDWNNVYAALGYETNR